MRITTHCSRLLIILLAASLHASANNPQHRIVSAGGTLTEIAYALGAGDMLVGVDTTSYFPEATDQLPKIGYMRALSSEGILSLDPSMMLASPDAGPPPVIQQLKQSGLRIENFDYPQTPEGVADMIRHVAEVVNRKTEAERLIQNLQVDAAKLAGHVQKQTLRPRVLFILDVGRGAPMAGGRDTSAEAIIKLAGGVNAMDGFEGFKPLNAEAIILANPDILLVTDRTLRLSNGADKIFAMPGIASSRAGRERKLIAMDGLMLLGFGPRFVEAARELNRKMQQTLNH